MDIKKHSGLTQIMQGIGTFAVGTFVVFPADIVHFVMIKSNGWKQIYTDHPVKWAELALGDSI